ncbi:TonB-dependent receptor plug domain-containing protein [Tenacibaculum retecalamus]|uniref:TonB-dependent receptor plug domain-containing protein n=1 Tax=Tenacibaculum retecalamus TaxID=3018315 RepID=UPI0023D92034|nr:TonB-dependent receptor plug domain-containing protein [Tenacibaculum retecalamus]WBX70120.1 TonB-dependent receptor [Tenacibaculum retecalamus]
MNKQLLIVGAIATLFASTKIIAQEQEKIEELDEVIVTATKTKMSKKNVGKIVYKLTTKEIEERQGKSLTQLLNEIPGIEINGSQSNRGQNLGVYIRGGRNKQTAVLIDGINVNDPSSIAGDFDLRQLDLNQIESIEVLKGASSVLYGSGAAAGVINIILKKESKKEFEGTFTTSLGSNRSAEHTTFAGDELQANFNFKGKVDKVTYLLGLNSNSSSGLSAIESLNSKANKEDKFYRQNALLKIGYKINNKVKVGIQGSFNEFNNEFDSSYPPEDADYVSGGKQNRAVFSTDFKYAKGELKARAFYTEIDRESNSSSKSVYQGEVKGFDVFNSYRLSNQFSFLTGITAQYQDMLQETSYSNIAKGTAKQHFYDPYVSLNYNSDFGFNVNGGVRMNIHNEYGNHFVYNINPSYNFEILEDKNLKLFASYGTAFITPTLTEIFNRADNIDELTPEKDFTIEGGFEFDVLDNLTLNATYFYREETDKVAYSAGRYLNNIGTFNLKGIEAGVIYKPLKKLSILADYTYVNFKGGVSIINLPKQKFGASVNYQLASKTFVNAAYRYTGERETFGGILDSYSIIDFFINHKVIKDKVTFFGSVTNLLNENFQDVNAYTARGRNYNLGLKVRF